jgi:hypothetical protein
MSEIEKMMQNVGIKLGCCKYAEYGYEGEEGTWYYCKKEGKECWTYPNGNANCVEKGYPPFTAEKQLEILNFCLKCGQVHILKGIDDEYRIENSCYRQGYQPTLADAIANYINEKWEKLTPEEKQQVKGILE